MGIQLQLSGTLVASCFAFATMATAQRVLPLPSDINSGMGKGVTVLSVQNDGRVLVGGLFDSINGVSRKNLARLNADGSIDATWSVSGIDGKVTVIASAGDRVFFGGEFTHVAGQLRLFLAAVDRTTGALLDWNPSPTYPDTAIDELRAMLVSTNGSTVYVTGLFSRIGGQNVANFASLDAQTGTPKTPWANDAPRKRGYSLAIVRDGDPARDVLYVGGDDGIAAVDTSTGTGLGWQVDSPGPVTDMAFVSIASGDLIIAGGTFSSGAGGGFQSVAAFYRANMYLPPGQPGGTQLVWNPRILTGSNVRGQVNTIAIHDRKLFVAGDFTSAGGAPRNSIAQVSLPWSEAATDWYPMPGVTPGTSRPIETMAVSGSTVFIGGRFNQVGGDYHYGIAAIAASELIFRDGFDGATP